MMGRSHLITGVCALEHLYVAGVLADKADIMPLTAIKQASISYLDIAGLSAVTVPVYLGMYFLGVLLPDIDNPKSLLGRIVHVPMEHRTWLHAVYLYFVFAVLGCFYPAFSWLFLGAFVHLFWDSLSAGGNCWFYKLLSDYRRYPGGAKIKKGHKVKLYHAGEWSEYLLLFIIVVVTVASFIRVRKLL